MEVIEPSPVQEPLEIENAGGDGAVKLSMSQKKSLKKKRKLMEESSVHEPLKMENAGGDGVVKLSKSEKKRLKEELNVIKPSPVHEPLKLENAGGDGVVKLSKSEKKRLKEELNVIKPSPVHEPLKMENAGGDGAVKLTKSRKKRLKKKRKLEAESLEKQQQTPDFCRTSSTPLQNNSLDTTKTGKVTECLSQNTSLQKGNTEELKNKNPSSGDMISVHESTKEMSTVKKDSVGTATDDAKMVSKGEEQTKVTNGKMVSKGKNQAKSTKGKMVLQKSNNHNKDGTGKKSGMHRSTNRRPTLGEILNPQYLELWGPGYAKMAKESQNEKKQEAAKAAENLERENQVRKLEKIRTMEPIMHKILIPRNLEEQGIVEAKNESQKEKSKVKASDDDITHGAKLEKKLLIFDINGLLVDIVSPRPHDMIADKYIPKRAIFKRPFLDDFLSFCFEKFTIGIWSSRTKEVLDPVVDFLFGDLKKNLLFIWDHSNCTNTGMRTLEDRHKPVVLKNLNKFWSKNGPGNSWVKGTFHESNTLLLDDSPYKALLNPKYTGIFPESYSYQNRNDDVLGPNGALRTYLEGLADSDNVKTYVEQHPFGQRAIDQTHRHWNFYSKVLKGQNITC